MGVRLIGVANTFTTLVDLTKRFEAQSSRFYDDFDRFVALASRSDAKISRSGEFLVSLASETSEFRADEPIALILLRMRARGTNTESYDNNDCKTEA
jgi:hypothetical protein